MQPTDRAAEPSVNASASTETARRLLIVEDHPIMRYGLAQLVADESDLEIAGEAGNAAEAMTLLDQLQPDLVVIDLTLPDKNGLELLKDIQALHPGTRCLVLSMHDEDVYGERCLRAGARGYLMKEVAAAQFVSAARRVLSGALYVSEALNTRMLENAVSGRAPTTQPTAVSRLSDRELEVLEKIGRGIATKNIAEHMSISPRTVEAHRAHIKEKLGLTDGAELVRFAVQWVDQSH
ncbi:MAG: response regulator transcription factor [Verrucomicrobiales bacterium]|nr:response regulator transcription factor [Verrucomicrobiales bacterium]